MKDLEPDDFDNEGFRACKKCQSRNTLVSGPYIDEIYISCLDCNFAVGPGEPYFILNIWNEREVNDKLPKTPF